ncbi:phosphatidylinositol transfer protein csr1 [Diatrype stigma]|uniref:Phosphatidylinositol transfer protein csr1 n=1 Tax=Diatrype stigma TaxID=117547 RepID=A0AAN9UAJ7_9PEZI
MKTSSLSKSQTVLFYSRPTGTQLKSSVSLSALCIAPLVAVAVAFVIYEAVVPGQQSDTADQARDTIESIFEDLVKDLEEEKMAEALPGRPGNLTPEQEEKLRKFWEVFLQVCGVLGSEEGDAPATSLGEQGKTGTDKTPKKKRHMSLFKKKDKKDKDGKDKDSISSEKTASSDSTTKATSNEDDKWGENKTYQEVLAKHTPEAIRSTIWAMVKHDHPDALLLRFLRARKWDVQKALSMLLSTMHWRASEAHVDDDIMVHGEALAAEQEKTGADEAARKAGADFLAQMRLGKSYIHGVDNSGRLICVVKAALHRAGEQSEESLERYTVYLIETSRLMLKPPADTACIIFDMTGFSLANMDYAPVKFMIRCFEANYPESLGVVLVHKAPWVFQGIWKVIRGWLDPVVASKVNFTNNAKDLEQFIAPERIMRELDGGEDWAYQYVEPVDGENAAMADTAARDALLREREALYEEYEQRTVDWIGSEEADKRAAAQAARNEVARKLDTQYWRLDPYVRARSLYDRVGIIKPGGVVDYYPSTNGPAAAAATNGTAAATTADTSADDVD